MRFLANSIMRGPMMAVLVVSVAALSGLLFPPLGYLSAAGTGLVTLRLGLAATARVLTGAVLFTGLAGAVLLGNPLLPLGFLLALWLPMVVVAWSLRRTANLARSLHLAALFGLMVVLGFHFYVDDATAWWTEFLGKLFAEAPAGQQAVLLPALNEIAGLMTGMVGAATALGLMLSLLLARWWQAMLYNPGGFREEFHALRMGQVTAGLLVLLLVAIGLQGAGTGLLRDVLPLMLLLLMWQGLALLHALIALRGMRQGWLVAVYVLLLLPMLTLQMVILLAMAGGVDNWVNFRARAGQR